jgi:hypothetical protein
MNRLRHPLLILTIILFLTTAGISHGISWSTSKTEKPFTSNQKHGIISQGLKHYESQYFTDSSSLRQLTLWYDTHPQVAFATLIQTTITVKFIDETYIILMNPSLKTPDFLPITNESPIHGNQQPLVSNGYTAVLLHAAEYLYGYRPIQRIISILLPLGYTLTYRSNTNVNLRYIENNLSADIVYLNTHAGYWDIDGDEEPDLVVIGTGEYWTNETPQQYQFEYDNQMIVEGMVGDTSFIAFTPTLINHFYQSEDFPNSLIYMATCHACYDDSMATVFLENGAGAYLGWSQNTLFWTNSITSSLTFRLLSYGFTIQQVCKLIRSGGIYNFILRSKLTYYGDGDYQIP